MILTKQEIIKELNSGRIKIKPFDSKNLGPASYDLTLGDKFRIFKTKNGLHHIRNDAKYEEITKVITVKDHYFLKPGETIHGITKERITLPENIAGWLQGRSRFARFGLMVHITASFVQPGVNNRQVLELNNASNSTLAIHPNTKIAQIIFERCEGKAKYKGRFRKQEKP